jgi:hypothetical protein
MKGAFSGGSCAAARTSFEGHELNAMIDLVGNADPRDLESAGTALRKAGEALGDVADELQDHIGRVDWKGESGSAFRTFGKGLAGYARDLGAYAGAAGTQIMAAGTGLASVHRSMPPRDSRTCKQTVDEIAVPERVAGNPAYDAALAVERNRQEAVNQLNRLASFYAVTGESLAAQEEPEFGRILNPDVPPPAATSGPDPDATAAGGDRSGESSGSSAPRSAAAHTVSRHPDGAPGAEDLRTLRPVSDQNPSTEIDSVAAPPAPTTRPGAPAPLPAATAAAGSAPPLPSPFFIPAQGGAPRPAGVTRPPGTARMSAVAAGRSGTAGRPGTSGGGRTAVGGAGTGETASSWADRTHGIVGGSPQRPAGDQSRPRLPRGTVIGAEMTAQGNTSPGRTGKPDVVAAHSPAAASRTGGRSTAAPNGLAGPAPGGTPVAGAALRGPSGARQRARPDYLTEDEETWTAGWRRAVPPVIE